MKKYLIILMILSLILVTGCSNSQNVAEKQCPQVVEKQCPVVDNKCIPAPSKALVDVEMAWDEESSFIQIDENHTSMAYRIYNYGDGEAKNINVKCTLYDEKQKSISRSGYDYGNLGPKSVQLVEQSVEKPKTSLWVDIHFGFCYVDSCDNCDILYKLIPSIDQNIKNPINDKKEGPYILK